MIAFVDPLSGYAVTIHAYQWGWTDGREFVTREFGTTPFGAWYRQGTEHQIRSLTVRFVGTDDVIDQLQMMSMVVMRHGGPVQFYPDAADPSTSFSMVWPETLDLGRVIENREEASLVLPEALGVAVPPPPNVTYVAQAIIEVLLRHDAVHLGQAVIEVVVQGSTATSMRLGQAAIEVMTQGSPATAIRVGQSVIEVMIAPS